MSNIFYISAQNMLCHPESDQDLTQELQYLVQIHKELSKLLRDCAVSEPEILRHSLFSSKRVFRTDELGVGLHSFGKVSVFSEN